MTQYLSLGASTQSRATRPGRPVQLRYASGVYERTTDGRNILSWPMGQHGGLLGFPSLSNKYTTDIVLRLQDLMASGYASCGSYAPEVEEQLAEELVNLYSKYLRATDNQVRLAANGTDSTQAAVALARATTNRRAIISVGYHGGSSPVFNFPPQDAGVLDANHTWCVNVAFENFEDWSINYKIQDSFAALVVEVPPMHNEADTKRILFAMRKYCDDNSICLIMDEIVTGFRYSLSGALGYHNCIKADFVCLGKSLSTYGKVSALITPADIMELLSDQVFFSYTYNDHAFGVHDALLTIQAYKDLGDDLYSHIDRIGGHLKVGLNEVFNRHSFPARVYGHNSRTTLVGDNQKELWKLLSKVVDDHNVLLHRPQFATMAHRPDDCRVTIRAVDESLKEMGY